MKCKNCGEKFEKRHREMRYCSRPCRRRAQVRKYRRTPHGKVAQSGQNARYYLKHREEIRRRRARGRPA